MTNNKIDLTHSISDRELIRQLEQITLNLSWFSEAEYPIRVVYWNNLDADLFDENNLLQQCQHQSGEKVAIQDFDTFFATAVTEKSWHNEIEKAEVAKYQTIVSLMANNLTDLQVYLLGEVEINAYILGKTKESAIAGLTTKIVAT